MDSRAERKVESGKLVRVDVTATEIFEDVELHGDFFVYPEAALDRIEESVEGVSVDASLDTLEQRVAEAAGDADLVGFDAGDVAAVLREAVTDAE